MFSLILPEATLLLKLMSDAPPDLEIFRQRIDEIDDRLQDLLIERTEIVARSRP